MARRTVENINGFVMARQPTAPLAILKKPNALLSHPKLVIFDESGKKKSTTPASKAVNPSASTKQKEKSNSRPVVKKETPKRNVTTKKEPVKGKIKPTEPTKINQNTIKHDTKVENVNKILENPTMSGLSISSDQEEYEDDFEDYESDFESDTSVESTTLLQTVGQTTSDSGGVDVKFALPVCVEEKLEPFLDEKYEVDALEQTIEKGLQNFKTAGKRKREQEVRSKIKTRGNILMGMIKLDSVTYTLLDLPTIPYEQYIKMYGRSNMTQIQTQTHDDNADKEIQTNEIDLIEKWTQRPIILTHDMDCSSSEYQSAKLGVGGGGPDARGRRHLLSRVAATADPDRLCAVGRTMLSVLELGREGSVERRLADSGVDFSRGHLRPAVSDVAFLADRPVISVGYVRIAMSAEESLLTAHEVNDLDFQFVLCVWSTSNTKYPEFALKCPNRVMSFCSIIKSVSGYVVAAQKDGSICVWDLRESRLHHQMINSLPCPLRSPSFNTALSVDQGHRSQIIGISTVTYRNAIVPNQELPDEICSLDEDFLLVLWTVMDSWTDGSEILEHKSAGTAPWSSVRLVKMQTFEANKNVPRCMSEGVVATCMFLNDNQDAFIGTNSGLVFRCNLGEHKVWPQYYIHKDKGSCFPINWLDICPFDSNYFLVTSSSGEVLVFCVNRRETLRRLFVTPGLQKNPATVLKAQWCTGFPGIVIGLDSTSSIHVWDLCDDVYTPVMSVPFNGKIITSMALTSSQKRQNTYLGLSFADGAVEMHLLKFSNRKTAKEVDDNDDDFCNLFAQVLAAM